MGSCEPGQGLTSAAISGHPFVRGVSHRTPTVLRSGGISTAAVSWAAGTPPVF
jgi:hypothetical protein